MLMLNNSALASAAAEGRQLAATAHEAQSSLPLQPPTPTAAPRRKRRQQRPSKICVSQCCSSAAVCCHFSDPSSPILPLDAVAEGEMGAAVALCLAMTTTATAMSEEGQVFRRATLLFLPPPFQRLPPSP